MRANRLTEVLRSSSVAVSAWLSTDSPYLAEVFSHCGFDAVTVDLQHGMFGIDRAIALLQAVSTGRAVPMARCPSHDPATIGKLLDAGAYGIICPSIDNAAEAAAFVRACRYPPLGERSFGPSRGLLYGGPDYAAHADTTVLTWAMIESRVALENVEDILATPGLDGVYVGPNDLALSLGETPAAATLPAPVRAALAVVADAARRHGRWAGAFCSDGVVAREMVELGYHFVTPGNDVGILRAAATARIAQVRALEATAPEETGGY
jgi:4-hydroxy-2-oxoheptanedioate aldolase